MRAAIIILIKIHMYITKRPLTFYVILLANPSNYYHNPCSPIVYVNFLQISPYAMFTETTFQTYILGYACLFVYSQRNSCSKIWPCFPHTVMWISLKEHRHAHMAYCCIRTSIETEEDKQENKTCKKLKKEKTNNTGYGLVIWVKSIYCLYIFTALPQTTCYT